MGETSIEWTDHSVNPIRFNNGHFCQKISPGCKHCYASRLQARFGNPGFKGTGGPLPVLNTEENGATDEEAATDGNNLWLDESKLREVLRRKKPTRYFWCDMTDLFGSWVPDEWIDRCFATMALTPRHTHQVLTKRPERMAAYCGTGWASRLWNGLHHFVGPTMSTADDVTRWCRKNSVDEKERYRRVGILQDLGGFTFPKGPLPNVWLGVSVEDRERKARIDQLRGVPAAVRFLSLEPLLEDLGTIDLTGISWVIIGGESGPGSRPMHPDWARSLRDQCREANVPFFFKQWGDWQNGSARSNNEILLSDGRHGETPQALGWSLAQHEAERRWHAMHPTAIARVGKKAAGRLLDGREWNEFPGVAGATNRREQP